MQTKEQELTKALITLSDEIWPIKENLKKACILLQEITDEYFSKYENKKEKDELGILWEFSRYGTYAEMIDDYVHAAKKGIEDLTEIIEQDYAEKNSINDLEGIEEQEDEDIKEIRTA